MADNPDLAVEYHDERRNGTYYTLNTASQVKHTRAGTWICLLRSCAGIYDPRNKDRYEGCAHTRAAQRYQRARDRQLRQGGFSE